jgi:hypothetical protein
MAHVSISMNQKKGGIPIVSANKSGYDDINIDIRQLEVFIHQLNNVGAVLKESQIDKLLKGIKQ